MSSTVLAPPIWLRQSCQRIPFAMHICIALIAVYGPTSAPWLFISTSLAAHIMLLCMCCFSLIGSFYAWRGARAHAAVDWRAVVDAQPAVMLNEKELELDLESDPRLRPGDVRHLILVPNYKEDLSTLRETLSAFAAHPRAAQAYHLCLGMEAREVDSASKAKQLVDEYAHCFAQLVWSEHPGDIPGEAAGKSSNVSWASRSLAAATAAEDRSRQVFTVIDADTHLSASYFDELSVRFAALELYKRQRALFTLPLLFNRNSDQVPVFVRQVDAMWCSAGLSSVFPASNLKIPTSAYSVSAELAENAGFWDAGPDAIGEDMHMLCKLYFATSGTVHLEGIYSPASCLDVVGNAHGQGFRGYVSDCQARYGQALRHLWGSLDSGYVLAHLLWPYGNGWAENGAVSRPSSSSGRSSPLPAISKRPSSLDMKAAERSLYVDYNSDATAQPRTLSPLPPFVSKLFSPTTAQPMSTSLPRPSRLPVLRTAHLLMRLYHAHFLLVHLFIFLVCKPFFTLSIDPYANPYLYTAAGHVVLACNAIGAFSVVSTIVSHLFYEAYCRAAGQRRRLPWCLLDMTAIPFGLVYSLLPALHAQTMHLFTNRLTYTVSIKPATLVKRAATIARDTALTALPTSASTSSMSSKGLVQEKDGSGEWTTSTATRAMSRRTSEGGDVNGCLVAPASAR